MKFFVSLIVSLLILVSIFPGFAKASDPLTLIGPIIDIQTPLEGRHFDGPFDFHINFLSHTPGQGVDMESLRVNYLKFLDIDITEKIRPYIK